MSQQQPAVVEDAPDARGKFSVSEDWLATLVGLVLLVACLTGLITTEMIP